jgi:arginine decarboxylase
MIPKKMFLTKGHGTHRHRLQSFELALRNAGIASCNLVNVSSIFPPKCEFISRKEGIGFLKPGEITYCVLSHIHTKDPETIGASIGVAIPKLDSSYGYIAEYHERNESEDSLKKTVEDLAILMLSTTKGESDPTCKSEKSPSDEQIINRFKNQMITQSIADTIEHTNKDQWSTVVAVAVFIG